MAHNALALRMLIDQIAPHLSKDNEEVNTQVKPLQVMLDAIHDQKDEDHGCENDHWHSPHGDSANSITPPEEHGRGHGRDNLDLCDVICGRDARGRIEKRRLEREREEQKQGDERDYDYYGPYYDQPYRQPSPEGGHIPGGVKAYCQDLKRLY
jgi:hypothetical protein